ncbi:MAG: hypothetical protein J1E40_07185 [Oscillospiraceae bacterium]|nr:hypothetical protein [Oscillospiraceae bacterium]
MEKARPFCRKCLFEDIDREGVYSSIKELIDALPEDKKTPEAEYHRRLDICRKCDSLGEGTCGKCGCFVELRAAKKNMDCPHENHYWKESR